MYLLIKLPPKSQNFTKKKEHNKFFSFVFTFQDTIFKIRYFEFDNGKANQKYFTNSCIPISRFLLHPIPISNKSRNHPSPTLSKVILKKIPLDSTHELDGHLA